MEHKETGCQAHEGPILCINKCGFFGSAATMNMCSKCHKETIMKQEQAKLAGSSTDNIVNGNDVVKESVIASNSVVAVAQVEVQVNKQPADVVEPSKGTAIISKDKEGLQVNKQPTDVVEPSKGTTIISKDKEGLNRCNTCSKRVGLTGFKCRCGNLYCALHRYSDKHDCKFDYRAAARDAIAKANPLVKAEKLNKI